MTELLTATIPLVIKIEQDDGGELVIEGDFTFPIWKGFLGESMLKNFDRLDNNRVFLVGGKE